MSGPRFSIGEVDDTSKISIYDDDFGFDALFVVSGDWLQADKKRYAEAVCAALNAAAIPIRDDSQSDASDVTPR